MVVSNIYIYYMHIIHIIYVFSTLLGEDGPILTSIFFEWVGSSSLKMVGWNTIVSFWGPAYFQGLYASFGEGRSTIISPSAPNILPEGV